MSHSDAKLIEQLGGPATVSRLLEFDKKPGGIQRVQNWVKRGIPAAIKVQFPELFLAHAENKGDAKTRKRMRRKPKA